MLLLALLLVGVDIADAVCSKKVLGKRLAAKTTEDFSLRIYSRRRGVLSPFASGWLLRLGLASGEDLRRVCFRIRLADMKGFFPNGVTISLLSESTIVTVYMSPFETTGIKVFRCRNFLQILEQTLISTDSRVRGDKKKKDKKKEQKDKKKKIKEKSIPIE